MESPTNNNNKKNNAFYNIKRELKGRRAYTLQQFS